MDYHMIEHLGLENGPFTIKVRVVRMWDSTNPEANDELFSLEVILVDQVGKAIQGTMRAQDAAYFRRMLEEGGVYVLSNFIVAPNNQTFRVVPSDLLVRLTRMTSIRRTENVIGIPSYKFFFIDFENLHDRQYNDAELTDVIGHVVSVGHISRAYVRNRITVKKNLEIQNSRGVTLQVTFWGRLAESFPENLILEKENNVVITLAGMTVRSFRGKICLCSCSATKFYLDLNIPEVIELKNSSPHVTGATQLVLEDEKPLLSPEEEANDNKKTVMELQCLNPVNYENIKLSCQATIADIDVSDGWWYNACPNPKCKRGMRAYANKYWCDYCVLVQNSSLPWYKVTMIVEDESGKGRVIAFGKVISDVVGITAAALSANPLYSDRLILPPILQQLLGRTFIFRAVVECRDIRRKTQVRIIKILKELDMTASPSAGLQKNGVPSLPLMINIKQEPLDENSIVKEKGTELELHKDKKTFQGKTKITEDVSAEEDLQMLGGKKMKT